MRPGGEKRGSSYDRARRRVWLLATFDMDLGPDKARCALAISENCRQVVDKRTLTADRIDPGGTYAHIIFRDQDALDDFVQGAVVEAIHKAADDFQRSWPVYGDDWLRERADALAKQLDSGNGNIQPACTPCQNRQGALITRERRHQWVAWMDEARQAGVEWDGVM